ncbi:hypothetical protein [Cellulomonas soli]|uniref:Uncharacterized protein n=1 Tax=Cellulomonas soli TaxID=931535 RepID=A0A512PHX3_9CELL|nr:hypothetical protein [Cellulomonas soli]NYI58812.1 type VI protein secretion system component VasK [Cellulomonas soli]GEP70808.1 hypothetical protein CSO01_35230 [Cellulomonas soli]
MLSGEEPAASGPSSTKAVAVGVIALVALVLNLVGGYWIPAAMCVLLLAAVVTFLWGPTLVGDPGPGRTRARRSAAVGGAVILLLTLGSIVAHLGAGRW